VIATCATLFSGGGLADVGLKRAGLTPLWAVEYDPAIASVYAANHGAHVIVGDVRGVDFATLERPDLLWASPPCPNFSVAKTGRGETALDLEIADAVVRAIETLRPTAFVLENVRGYADSQSYRRIRAALDRLDYWSDADVVNAADLGTPQTRERLILRARAGGWMQAHRPWPAPRPWVGWYAAIEDLIPTLPDSAFAPWQLARLPAEIRESVLVPCDNTQQEWGKRYRSSSEQAPTMSVERGLRAFVLDGEQSSTASGLLRRDDDQPCMTIGASQARQPVRAFLVHSTDQRSMPTRGDAEPAFTVMAGSFAHSHQPGGRPKAYLPPGRVVALTPRCLARFQGLPDSYWLPEKKSLACRVIGNGVAVEVAYEAARSLL
jgi:DNA (cytosine-5)-methyltransferase 1